MSSEPRIARTRLSYRSGWKSVQQTPRKKIFVRAPCDERQRSQEVVDDFPQVVPIASTELEAIETYLGSVIDQLLGRVAINASENKGGE